MLCLKARRGKNGLDREKAPDKILPQSQRNCRLRVPLAV